MRSTKSMHASSVVVRKCIFVKDIRARSDSDTGVRNPDIIVRYVDVQSTAAGSTKQHIRLH